MKLKDTIAALKDGHLHGPPNERCLRCDEPHDFVNGLNLYWNDGLPGGRHESQDDLVGGLCDDCLAELAEEWGKCD